MKSKSRSTLFWFPPCAFSGSPLRLDTAIAFQIPETYMDHKSDLVVGHERGERRRHFFVIWRLDFVDAVSNRQENELVRGAGQRLRSLRAGRMPHVREENRMDLLFCQRGS